MKKFVVRLANGNIRLVEGLSVAVEPEDLLFEGEIGDVIPQDVQDLLDAQAASDQAQVDARFQLRNALKRVDDIASLADAKVFLKKLVKYLAGIDQG